MTNLERIVARVKRASAELDAHEYPPNNGPYFTLTSWSYRTTLAQRIDLATAIYLHGNAAMLGSRCFDNCFEMGDGRAVCAELTRRANADPRLFAAIAGNFGGSFPKHWLENVAQPQLAL